MPQRIDLKIADLFAAAPELRSLLEALPMKALDIGARRGFAEDLLPLAPAIDAVGFEPDRVECERLNADATAGRHPWRSLRYLPIALGQGGEPRTLHLYRQRGCSSLLEADRELASDFSRGEDYVLDDTVLLAVEPLDDVAGQNDFADAVYLKIDVQGFEREVFDSGRKLLQSCLLAVRTEVTMMPLYRGMPLAEDIMMYLRGLGFMPMGFEELHHWRRGTRIKHPRPDKGAIPFSRGQMMHGDLLFLRDPALFVDDAEANLKSAFLALTYGYVDHAWALLQRPAVQEWLRRWGAIDLSLALHNVSLAHARLYRRQRRQQILADLKFALRQALLPSSA